LTDQQDVTIVIQTLMQWEIKTTDYDLAALPAPSGSVDPA
jgi:hypothetical protein